MVGYSPRAEQNQIQYSCAVIYSTEHFAMRDQPNIIITGTPGVGKTTHCEMLAQNIGLNHLSINQISKEQDIRETYDEELKTWIVDEDKVRWHGQYHTCIMWDLTLLYRSWMPSWTN